ncbi:ATP-dependent acyl-CoA ligase [Variovorax sp. J22R133]|uniref:ATP-dependent acyl-CoA ligase n=1 Tax=Variovorax brevis TaxID=3053503 RepID=UPI00257874D6|nr:ATP-dependent acyl-CoA ligase [Variovorax sp. J22R133]MDM0112613.1 ATP-dependent acyl-CoA ligase [Variovorax sp. J22R133]
MNAFDVLLPAERTLPAMLQRQATQYGDKPALSIAGVRWTHTQAAGIVAKRAAALKAAGVQRGDRVALMCGNRVECLETFLACGWIGAVSVPINTASMGPQIEYFLANSGARLLVIEDALVDRLQTADLSKTELAGIWIVGEDKAPSLPAGVTCTGFPAANEAAESAEVQPGDTLAILYTSGTTGPAKGVICPHAQFYWWGANTARILDVGADDVLCTTLPLFHINALNTFAQAALTGAEVVYAPRFSASGFWPAMQACGATVVYLLGAMVPILLAQPEGERERAHRVRIGLGPGVPAQAGDAFRQRTGVQLLEGYGSTETNFAIATHADAPRKGVMGWLQPGFEARVADAADAALPDGEAGELLLRADQPFAFATGYFNMPDKTVEAWRNLWFHTGDRVVREADGSFRFIDRMKDAIRRRGENISSYEVEQVLLSHPSVATVAVYPVQSELAEDEVMASLIAQSGENVDPAELANYCEARLPYFAIPRYIDIVDDLPRTENGKIQKFKLRERGITPSAWDRLPPRRA